MRLALVALLALAACGTDTPGQLALPDLPEPPTTPPAWAAEAVWYRVDLAPPDSAGAAAPDSLAADSLAADTAPADTLAAPAGGVQDVIDALPRLDALGVTALSLGAVFDGPGRAPAARSLHHVAGEWGPDPDGDRDRGALDDPADPATWGTTAADDLLLDLVEAAHDRGVRVVLDVALGHTSDDFWAFQDLRQRGERSAVADWYDVSAWDDPATPDTVELAYATAGGDPARPAFRTVNVGRDGPLSFDGDLATGPKSHALAAAVRWLDPDGDGDPSDGVDGFRLVGADAVPLGFWADLRRVVKAVNADAVLVGEVAGGHGLDPALWLGDAFDTLADGREADVLALFLAPGGPLVGAVDVAIDLGDLYDGLPADALPTVLMTGAAVPDSLADDSGRSGRLAMLLRATLPGAPVLTPADEGDRLTRRALAVRRASPGVFERGTLTWDASGDLLRFVRRGGAKTAVVVVNRAPRPARVGVPVAGTEVALAVGGEPLRDGNSFTLAPDAGAVFVRESR